MLSASGNLFKCHEEVLYLQPLIPPKRFDIFSPITGGCSEGLGVLWFFFKLLLLYCTLCSNCTTSIKVMLTVIVQLFPTVYSLFLLSKSPTERMYVVTSVTMYKGRWRVGYIEHFQQSMTQPGTNNSMVVPILLVVS